MNALVVTTLSVAAISSATGMILFRYGGRGNTTIAEFLNVYILLGCIVYLIGAIAGLYSLSRVSAAQAYPFTVLHAVLLYVYSSALLGEKLTTTGLVGCGLILVGLFLVMQSSPT
jgi:drug/metabolite transporter (DMT)-like permease